MCEYIDLLPWNPALTTQKFVVFVALRRIHRDKANVKATSLPDGSFEKPICSSHRVAAVNLFTRSVSINGPEHYSLITNFVEMIVFSVNDQVSHTSIVRDRLALERFRIE